MGIVPVSIEGMQGEDHPLSVVFGPHSWVMVQDEAVLACVIRSQEFSEVLGKVGL